MRVLLGLAALVLLLAPLAQAHAQAGGLVPLGTPARSAGSSHAAAATAPAAFAPLSLSPEPSVGLAAVGRSDDASWAAAPETTYNLQFSCPPQVEQTGPAPAAAPEACPSYVLDVEDVMAQPVLVVDPRDASLVAFNALHGGPGIRAATQDPLPTERSRSDLIHQPHTTFQSTDGGAFWDDNRYYPRLDGKAEVFGEDNAMASDAKGRLTIASLYSFYNKTEQSSPLPIASPTRSGQEPGYAIIVWSSDRISTPVDYDKSYIVHTAAKGHVYDTIAAAPFPAADSMVVAWRETDPSGSSLSLLHRATDGAGQWDVMEHAVNACNAITNPVAVANRLLVGCIQGKGERGDLHLYGIAANWTVEDLGMTPLRSVTQARLASAEALRPGGFVVAGAGMTDGRPHVWVALGVAPKGLPAFSRARDYGDHLTALAAHAGTQLLEARVTALTFVGTSATAHMLYMERYASGGASGPSGEFAKTYAVVQADGRYLGTWGVGFGDPQANANVPVLVSGGGTGVFDDLHDSLVVAKGKHGDERVFVAFGDHGYVRYAEVTEVQPPVPLFPPIGAPAAIPALTASTSPVVVGTVAGALSLAAVSRLALARSKKAAEAPAP
jgi:hypothetical protein